jgi:signal recognition particle subunit SRP54
MLDNLRTGLSSALKKIVGASDINEELIDSLCKDIQRALLQSDVNVRLVLMITTNLKTRAINETPPKGLSRNNHHSLWRTCKITWLYRRDNKKH